MELSWSEKTIVVLVIILAAVALSSFYLGSIKSIFAGQTITFSNNNLAAASIVVPEYVLPQKLSNPPQVVKAVYVTGYSAGSKGYLNYLTNLFKTTQINAVVVDIKGSSGYVSYASGAPDVKKYNLYNGAVKDIDALVNFFHSQNIYVIGRIAVFEDPVYSKARPELAIYNKNETTDLSKPILWQDNNKLSWLDPASKDVWNYDISLAKDAFGHGFDEVNFDYVRFPSDGKTGNMDFPVWDEKTPMAGVIKSFFEYTRQQLAGQKISVDLFGQTTSNKDDMGIGQLLENAFENFDYISPMVYPSHYINGFLGFKNPADHPYEVIKYAMDSALTRENNVPAQVTIPLAKFRPWLQDFNMGAVYTADMVGQEIKATQDSLGDSYSGFMLWNPSNIYTQGAILKPN